MSHYFTFVFLFFEVGSGYQCPIDLLVILLNVNTKLDVTPIGVVFLLLVNARRNAFSHILSPLALQVTSATATRYGLSRGLLGLKYDQIDDSDFDCNDKIGSKLTYLSMLLHSWHIIIIVPGCSDANSTISLTLVWVNHCCNLNGN